MMVAMGVIPYILQKLAAGSTIYTIQDMEAT